LRQVHLIHAELFGELSAKGFSVAAGELGENVTTSGIDLLGLPVGTRLHLGDDAVVEVSGLRDPCRQIDGLGDGLMEATLDHDADGNLIRKAGVMSLAIAGGVVHADDEIRAVLPVEPHVAMGPV
jgi:MOSC domain-containing protein YiiM